MATLPIPSGTPADQFFRAYGRAMLTWQTVELELFRFYFTLFEHGNLKQAGAAYYSQKSFGAKLALVKATASAVITDERLKTWNGLRNEIEAAEKDRNILAHRPAALDFRSGEDLVLVLAPPIFAPQSLHRQSHKKFDAAECDRLSAVFEELASKIQRLASATAI